MFEHVRKTTPGDASPAEEVRALRAALVDIVLATDPRDGVDQIDELERLKSAICATQARIAHEIDQHRQAQAAGTADAGAPTPVAQPRRRHRHGAGSRPAGVAARGPPQAAARARPAGRPARRRWPRSSAATSTSGGPRSSPARPPTSIAAQRRGVDAAVCHDLDGLGDADLRDLVRREVLSRDEEGWLARHARARAKRRVSGRIIGDGMGHLSAVLPATDLSMIMSSLNDAAEAARAGGDERTADSWSPTPWSSDSAASVAPPRLRRPSRWS